MHRIDEEQRRFGRWLKERRRSCDITQAELAGRVGCAAVTIQRFESGRRRPSKEMAERLLASLDIPEDKRADIVRIARCLATAQLQHRAANDEVTTPLQSLPVSRPLIGRERELQLVQDLLREAQNRCITLSGPPGVGKSVVAMQAIQHLTALFPGGIYWVEVDTANNRDDLLRLLLNALGFVHAHVVDLEAHLLSKLCGRRHSLLVIDGCEQITRDFASVATHLLRQTAVQLLVTSQCRIGLRAERVIELRGLAVPEDSHNVVHGTPASMQLFIERGREICPDFMPDALDRTWIRKICCAVDGLPLAIELAARWVHICSCTEIAANVVADFAMLTTDLADLPARQRSMTHILARTWSLLDESEQRVLDRLSVFPDTFSSHAAMTIAESSLAQIKRFCEYSLIQHNGDSMYRLHSLVQRYAALRLDRDTDDRNATRARFCDYYATRAQQAMPDIMLGKVEALRTMDAELEQLQQVLWWALEMQAETIAMHVIDGLFWFYERRGWYEPGLDLFTKALKWFECHNSHQACHKCVLAHRFRLRAAWCALSLGCYPETDLLLRDSICRVVPFDTFDEGILAYLNGSMALWHDDLLKAEKAFEQSRAIFQAQCWEPGLIWSLSHLGLVAQRLGRWSESEQRMRQALARSTALQAPSLSAVVLGTYGRILVSCKDWERAQTLLVESLRIGQAHDDTYTIAMARLGLAQIAYNKRNLTAACELLECVFATALTGRVYRLAQSGLTLYARCLEQLGEYKRALRIVHLLQTNTLFPGTPQHQMVRHRLPEQDVCIPTTPSSLQHSEDAVLAMLVYGG